MSPARFQGRHVVRKEERKKNKTRHDDAEDPWISPASRNKMKNQVEYQVHTQSSLPNALRMTVSLQTETGMSVSAAHKRWGDVDRKVAT